ncbi:MAG: RNA-binding S4 domain-containing protein [Symbiobacteriaceae bacterium]|nr:RNA-binding S4 domain-containing protein [Symbiobacteriaceae bacterium]
MPATITQSFTYHGDYITLGQFLKAANLIQSGGEARIVLSAGAVLVNGVVETRRGCKLRQGDLVQFDRNVWQLISNHQLM